MLPKKGKGLLLAVTPDDEEEAEVEDESDEDESEGPDEGQLDAADALMEAIASGDRAAVVDAFKAMQMACGGEY